MVSQSNYLPTHGQTDHRGLEGSSLLMKQDDNRGEKQNEIGWGGVPLARMRRVQCSSTSYPFHTSESQGYYSCQHLGMVGQLPPARSSLRRTFRPSWRVLSALERLDVLPEELACEASLSFSSEAPALVAWTQISRCRQSTPDYL